MFVSCCLCVLPSSTTCPEMSHNEVMCAFVGFRVCVYVCVCVCMCVCC